MNKPSFINEDVIKTKLDMKQLFWRTWPYLKRYPGLTLVTFLSVIMMAITSRALPLIIGYAIDNGILNKNNSVIQTSMWSYLIMTLLYAFFEFVNMFLFWKLGNRILYHIREELFLHTLQLPMDYFNRTPTGRTVTRLTSDVQNMGELFSDGIVAILTNGMLLISILLTMIWISPMLTFFTLILSPFFIIIALRLSRKIRSVLAESKKKLATLNSFVSENLSGIKVVQLLNRHQTNQNIFNHMSNDYKKLTLRSIHYYGLLYPTMSFMTAVILTSSIAAQSWLHNITALNVGLFIAFILNTQDFVSPLRNIIEKYQQFQNSLTSAERIFTILDEPTEPDALYLEKSFSTFKGKIEFKDLSFRYHDQQDWILKNIYLLIHPGERIAIAGRTGSGKSTLIHLLQKFYLSPKRSLFIDDHAIEDIPFAQLRRELGVIQQDPFIFKGTLASNISLDDPSISMERVEWAAEYVGLLKHLKLTHRDINYVVAEGATNLSLGERQLIAFARILAFDPKILILDEATANIDSQTESLIQLAIEKATENRTCIIVAHRLSTLKNCHRTFVMDRGHLRELNKNENITEVMAHS